jgi:hypothetical protein
MMEVGFHPQHWKKKFKTLGDWDLLANLRNSNLPNYGGINSSWKFNKKVGNKVGWVLHW